MNLINIDTEKCIKCSLCVNECPEHILKIGEYGPECVSSQNSIACGHCVAVIFFILYRMLKESPLWVHINKKVRSIP